MTFDVSLSSTECSNIKKSSEAEILLLSISMQRLFVSKMKLNESIEIEIVGIECGSLLIDFKMMSSDGNRDFTDNFEAVLADSDSSFEWQDKKLTYSGVESRIESSSQVESTGDGDDSKKTIWVPIVVFGIVILLGAFAALK